MLLNKLIIEPVRHSNILLFDDNFAKLKFNKFSYKFVDQKKINLFLLPFMIKNLLNLPKLGMSLKNLYIFTLIDLSKAKIIIGHHITGSAFKINKLKNNVITITYQHSYIYSFEKKIYKNLFKDCSCDYFLSYDKTQTKLFSSFIKAKFLEFGSLKNNEIILKKNKKNKKNKLLIISEFRMNKSSLHQQAIKLYLGNVKKFCLKKKLVPKVAFNSFRSDKQHIGADIYFKKEFEFYKKYLGNFSYERKSSYKLAAESDVIISMGSNLGYELLSRNFKVFFLNNLGNLDKRFVSTYFEKQKPFFFLRKNNYLDFEKSLIKILSMSSPKWKNVLEKFNYKIIYDRGNNKLKKLIKEII